MGNSEGYGNRALPLKELLQINDKSGRPAIIYIFREQETDEEQEKQDAAVFGSEDVAMASHFFTVFRISFDTISDKQVQAEYAKSLPAIVFLDGQGRTVANLTGKTSTSAVKAKMESVFNGHFAVAMGKQVAAYAEVLARLEKNEDKLADAQKRVDDMRARLDRRDSDKAKENLDEELAKLQVVKAERQKIQEELDAVLSPATRQPKADTAAR